MDKNNHGPTVMSDFDQQLAETVQQIQTRTLYWALIIFIIAGILLLASFRAPFNQPVYFIGSLIFLGVVPGLFFLVKRNYVITAWLVVIVSTCVLTVLIALGGSWNLFYLFMIPTCLATSLISYRVGILYNLAFSILLFHPYIGEQISITDRTIFLILNWMVTGTIIILSRPLIMAVRQAWEGFEKNQTILSQSREFQARLQATMEDFQNANIQLARLNKRIEALHQAAEEARQAKEQFVANISHELRTPLNMIIGYCEMMIESPRMYGKPLPAALLSDLNVIHRNSQHLLSLINDVLDLSQIEGGQMALNREWTNLADVINAAITAIKPLYVSKKLYLNVSIENGLPPVFCDVTRIREVMLNLLSNSGRFTEQGGVKIRVYRQDNFVIVSVCDTGPGISEKDKDKLFIPFQQLDTMRRQRYGGSGLGLAISKKFIEMHDGRIWLESTPGSGSTFYFSLPIKPYSPVAANPARWITPGWDFRERTHPSLAKIPEFNPRFVIYEQGDVLSKIIRRYMNQVDVITTSNADEVITELNRIPSQALLINSPIQNQLPDPIIASPHLQHELPIIITNIPNPEITTSELGVVSYLTKPISNKTVIQILDHLEDKDKIILLVDDDEEELRLYWRMLSQVGKWVKVMTAQNGKQALEILQTKPVGLLILDLIMPEMDGYTLLKIRSEDDKLRKIPAVIISALDPLGHPLISNTLTVTRKSGISIPQLLRCIEALDNILAPSMRSSDPTPAVKTSG